MSGKTSRKGGATPGSLVGGAWRYAATPGSLVGGARRYAATPGSLVGGARRYAATPGGLFGARGHAAVCAPLVLVTGCLAGPSRVAPPPARSAAPGNLSGGARRYAAAPAEVPCKVYPSETCWPLKKKPEALPDSITDICADGEGRGVWVSACYAGAGLFDRKAFTRAQRFPIRKRSFLDVVVNAALGPVNEVDPWALARSPEGRLWCVAADGLHVYEGETWALQADTPGGVVSDMCFDREGNAYIAFTGYVSKFAAKEGVWSTVLDPPRSRTSGGPSLDCVHVDRAGRIWVGGCHADYHGRKKIVQRWEHEGESWTSCKVWEPLYVRAGRKWRAFGKGRGLEARRVNDIAETPDGRIWLGTSEGVFVADGDNELTFRKVPWAQGTSITAYVRKRLHSAAELLAAESEEFGARLGLPARADAGGVTARVTEELTSDYTYSWVKCVAAESDERVWVGTLNGLFVTDGDVCRRARTTWEPADSVAIEHLSLDEERTRLWVSWRVNVPYQFTAGGEARANGSEGLLEIVTGEQYDAAEAARE